MRTTRGRASLIFSDERKPTRFAKTMAAASEIDSEVALIFGDSESEDNFNGFGEYLFLENDCCLLDLFDPFGCG